MILYIWLLWHQIVIYCNDAGCMQVSMAHFNYLFGIGALEMILEISGIIKIFRKKETDGKSDGNVEIRDSETGTEQG